jgi:UDP-2-acetamido-2,6-beta-L-arabino-hexul-4-ose reductase
MASYTRNILITGANGFIGKNLTVRLNELPGNCVRKFVRGDGSARLRELVAWADVVVHLAGVNRPSDDSEFSRVNEGLTADLCEAIKTKYLATGGHVLLLVSSSVQVESNNPYGRSKLGAEKLVKALSQHTGNPCLIFRLPGVFGKWCKPYYNSVVATFCYNLARDLPIQISDHDARVSLVYIDDVINAFLRALQFTAGGFSEATITPEYEITLNDLADQIRAFPKGRKSLFTERVGAGFCRALYATYVSYLPSDEISYEVPQHVDSRGMFVEMLKTHDSGQFSYFTAHPGITRGGHYHHTKTEKFLVIKGQARFRFRHLLTNEFVELHTSGDTPQVVDTVPGWTHDITNVGNDEMIVMLWANENFNPEKPDTVGSEILL